MNIYSKWKISMVVALCLLATYIVLPNFISQKYNNFFQSSRINLGLDLKGGAHLLLQVDFDEYLKDHYANYKDNIKKDLKSGKIKFTNLQSGDDFLSFDLVDEGAATQFTDYYKKISNTFTKQQEGLKVVLKFQGEYIASTKEKLLNQSIEIIRKRIDENGTKEPSLQKQGRDYILLQVPGLYNPEELKNLLGKTAKLSFHLTKSDYSTSSLKLKDEDGNVLLLDKKPVLSGEYLKDASVTFDDKNNPVVSFEFDSLGAKKFASITRQNKNNILAIVLDKTIISSPLINEPILSGSGVIKGNFTVESANKLALLLRAGALPAPLKIVEERSVGPSLGLDSIRAGKIATAVGFVSVMIFMVVSYRIFGIFSNIALFFNIVFILACLSILQATLTLPGIAGIVLTIGMAVDANVLIFERIKEEKRWGASDFLAIDKGFSNAFSTILDSNLTTIFAGIFLYYFGVGAVKGFAVTLIIGIVSSMFSAIVITRILITRWFVSRKVKRLPI